MRCLTVLLFATCALAQAPQISKENATRIHEFYRLAAEFQDQLWPGWSRVPSPLLLVVGETEFLTHHPAPPKDFHKIEDDLYARPRQFPVNFQATFPAFGPPAVIVIGEPSETESKASTPWLMTVMHEHFHQLQDVQPGYFQGVQDLNLSGGDSTGMWMLNYPFPYERPDVRGGFAHLRDLLLHALGETDEVAFSKLAAEYVSNRKKFFESLSESDHRYFAFQLWQEGIARYTQVKAAEAAARFDPTSAYVALPDYESFATYAARARQDTLDELKRADLSTWKRTVVYSFGAAEGFLLDRVNPKWRDEYFRKMFSTDAYFERGKLGDGPSSRQTCDTRLD